MRVLEEEAPGLQDPQADGVEGMVFVVRRLYVLVQPQDVAPTDPDVVERVRQTGVVARLRRHGRRHHDLQQGRVHVEVLVAVGHQEAL